MTNFFKRSQAVPDARASVGLMMGNAQFYAFKKSVELTAVAKSNRDKFAIIDNVTIRARSALDVF